MKTFFAADSHFGHSRILCFGTRLNMFPTIEEHDEALIANWNSKVTRRDIVYHCGDFAWVNVAKYAARLNGQIHLVMGNHDRLKSEDKKHFASISDLKTVKVQGQSIILCHYAMRVWNKSHYGAWHLYGHSHGSLPDDPNSLSFDVGMDCHGYYPIEFDEVKAIMSTKTYNPVDHHIGD